MGKICCISNCLTNNSKYRARRRQLGLKHLSLFRIPKRENMLEKWSEGVKQKLVDSDFLCERHFPEGSIIKANKTPMPDGTVHVLARDRYTLVAGSIPNAVDNYSEDEETVNIDKTVPSQAVLINGSSTQLPSHSEGISNHKQGIIDLTDNTNIANPKSVDEHRQQEANCSRVPDLIELGNAVDLNKATGQKNTAQKSKKKIPEKPKPLTFGDIFPHLEGIVLPETWAWVNNRYEENKTYLIQLKRDTLESRLRLILHEDHSVTLCTADGIVQIELQTRVTSIPIMIELLTEVGRMMVCEGSGMEEDRRAEDCGGVIGPREYSMSVRILRCTACRQLRKTLQSRLCRIKAEFDTEFAQSKEELNLTRLSCRRLKRKINSLKKKQGSPTTDKQ